MITIERKKRPPFSNKRSIKSETKRLLMCLIFAHHRWWTRNFGLRRLDWYPRQTGNSWSMRNNKAKETALKIMCITCGLGRHGTTRLKNLPLTLPQGGVELSIYFIQISLKLYWSNLQTFTFLEMTTSCGTTYKPN